LPKGDTFRNLGCRGLLIVCAAAACSSSGSSGMRGGGGLGGQAGSPGQSGGGGEAAGGAGESPGGAPGWGGGSAGGATGAGGGAGTWTLTWSDEFEGPAGQLPEATKWTYDIGGGGWGSDELEYYTQRPENVSLDGAGDLLITLRAEPYMGSNYTSARLRTQDLFAQAYGRFEARIKIPRGQGVWPAFWMLGTDLATVGWPTCGEIDIMENIGSEPAVNHGSLHGPYDDGSLTGTYQLPGGAALADAFHLYAIEWDATAIRFYVDDTLYETRLDTDVASPTSWVYNHPFFLLLNLAIGGTSPGAPDATTVLPQTMTVDYVRVYAR
jgi:beta-glucanase (GH16 family)